MSHTYYQLLYHFVWSTKDRRPLITSDFQQRLYKYMAGTFQSLNCYPVLIGGMPDHIHLCIEVPPEKALSDLVRSVKVGSTKWIRKNFITGQKFEWQEGYGVFSISPSSREAVLKYIKNQEKHHKKRDFREEFLWLLEKHEVEYDEKYLWK